MPLSDFDTSMCVSDFDTSMCVSDFDTCAFLRLPFIQVPSLCEVLVVRRCSIYACAQVVQNQGALDACQITFM